MSSVNDVNEKEFSPKNWNSSYLDTHPVFNMDNSETGDSSSDDSGPYFAPVPDNFSLIDAVPNPLDIPRDYYDPETNKYDQNVYEKYIMTYDSMKEQSLQLLKKYYEETLEAKYVVSAYIINLDHADESLDFAIKQFNLGIESSETIEDERIEPTIKELKNNVEKCNKLKEIIEVKRNMFNEISKQLDEYLEKIVAKNNIINTA